MVSSFLQKARLGNVDEDSYNFLHGYPTREPITYWHHRQDNCEFHHECTPCEYKPYHIRDHWEAWPANDPSECFDCWVERKRRARVLHLDTHWEQDGARLADPRFHEAVFITPYNVAVFHVALERAMNFARCRQAASFWIQATDSPTNWYANDYTKEDLLAQTKWLMYHSKRTDGILSPLLAYDDMPYRATHSNGT